MIPVRCEVLTARMTEDLPLVGMQHCATGCVVPSVSQNHRHFSLSAWPWRWRQYAPSKCCKLHPWLVLHPGRLDCSATKVWKSQILQAKSALGFLSLRWFEAKLTIRCINYAHLHCIVCCCINAAFLHQWVIKMWWTECNHFPQHKTKWKYICFVGNGTLSITTQYFRSRPGESANIFCSCLCIYFTICL